MKSTTPLGAGVELMAHRLVMAMSAFLGVSAGGASGVASCANEGSVMPKTAMAKAHTRNPENFFLNSSFMFGIGSRIRFGFR